MAGSIRKLTIRNMVCDRCKTAVQRILIANDLEWERVDLGEVDLKQAIDGEAMQALERDLESEGFGLVMDRDAQLIAQAKAAIVKEVHHGEGKRVELAKLVQEATNREISSVSKLFSEVEGITLEHYYLLQRIERVKELIRYGEMTFSEIAFATGFSSAAHLSAQFKQLTGMTPSTFKTAHGKRSALDKVGRSGGDR
ncbi:MAG: helix-turn-helix transcriptional regulator [Flavobacteriales bacterium]